MKRILKIVFFNISLIFFLNISFAEISYIEINSKGKAAKYEDALKKALKEAVSKVNGVTVKTESVLEIIDKSLTTNEGSTATLGRNLNEKISEKSGGSIKSFDILNEYEDANGLQVVEIRATVAKYVLSKTANRKRMAIVPFRINLNEISIYGKSGFDVYCKNISQKDDYFIMLIFRDSEYQESGVGRAKIVEASKNYNYLLGAECSHAITYFKSSDYFAMQKCKF